MKTQKGFTLLELLIVIIILGVLAVLFLPAFRQAREASLNEEARGNLKLIQAAAKIFHMNNGYYYGSDVIDDINSNLKTSLQNTTPLRWNYSIDNDTVTPFNITASREAGTSYNRTLWIDFNSTEAFCEGEFCK